MVSSSANYTLLLLLLLFSGCAKETTYPPEQLPDRLFIRGYIDPARGIEVLVTRAVSTADTILIASLLVQNATVQLVDEDGERQLIPLHSESRYHIDSAGLEISAGRKYRIEVAAPGLDAISSEWVTVPEKIALDEWEFEADGGFNGDAPTGSGFITFRDDPATTDAYLVQAYGLSAGGRLFAPNFGFTLPLSCEITGTLSDRVFNDRCLTGLSSVRAELFSDLGIYDLSSMSNLPFTAIIFHFGRVSPEYESFLFSLEQPEGWEHGLVEPKPAFTNIRNGLGIFYATNTTRLVIVL